MPGTQLFLNRVIFHGSPGKMAPETPQTPIMLPIPSTMPFPFLSETQIGPSLYLHSDPFRMLHRLLNNVEQTDILLLIIIITMIITPQKYVVFEVFWRRRKDQRKKFSNFLPNLLKADIYTERLSRQKKINAWVFNVDPEVWLCAQIPTQWGDIPRVVEPQIANDPREIVLV